MKTSITVCLCLLSFFWYSTSKTFVVKERSVKAVLEELGDFDQKNKPDLTIPGVSAVAGERLVKEGFATKENGKKTKIQSKHFVCISCHNIEKEEVNLAKPNAQSRLEYTSQLGIPFLQGTTLHGAINRTTFYNGDYDKKYGDLVKPAREDLREAVQLCAVECAQGRPLEDWEMESIIAYLWEIGLTMDDLIFDKSEIALINSDDNSRANREEKIRIIKSKYLPSADAHFVVPPFDRNNGYEDITGVPSNGKLIYENSCLYCHKNQIYSYLHLDNSKLSFKYLDKKAGSYHPHSLYQVTRWGVPVKSGKRSYMPQYTEEKMSNQQLEDLRSYIAFKANE